MYKLPFLRAHKENSRERIGRGNYLAKVRKVRAIGTYSDIGLHVAVVVAVPTVQVE